MTKKSQINFWKKQLRSSRELKEVAIQNYNLATRLENEALKNLELLGSKPDSKPNANLDEETKIKLLANLTKGATNPPFIL